MKIELTSNGVLTLLPVIADKVLVMVIIVGNGYGDTSSNPGRD